MTGRRVAVAAAILALAGCGGGDEAREATPSPTGSTTTTSAAPSVVPSGSSEAPVGSGAVHTTARADTATITRYPLRADGSVDPGVPLFSGPADEWSFPGVVDGLGDVVLTATFTDLWSSELVLRSAATGAAVTTLDGERWCGTDGFTVAVCVLLDEERLARTSELGGEDSDEATITISSLRDGSTVRELGPYPGLSMVLGTSQPDALILVTSPEGAMGTGEGPPGTVALLDVTTGAVTEIGTAPELWAPLCALGTDSVLGFTFGGEPTAEVVGPAAIAPVQWPADDPAVGCSPDGAHLYVQHYPDDSGDDQGSGPSATTLDRITLADGSRETILVLDGTVTAGPITR